MPTVIVENIPPEVYERLQQRAAADGRSLPEVMLHLVREALRVEAAPAPRLPDLISPEDVSVPCDLPRSCQPVPVTAYRGQPRLPDSFLA
jgi:plasmid stability protein